MKEIFNPAEVEMMDWIGFIPHHPVPKPLPPPKPPKDEAQKKHIRNDGKQTR